MPWKASLLDHQARHDLGLRFLGALHGDLDGQQILLADEIVNSLICSRSR